MRVITYILITLSCLFAINVFVAASSPSYKTFLQEIKSNIVSSPASATTKRRLTAEDIRTDKLIRSLDRLWEKVDAIQMSTLWNEASGSTLSGTTASGLILPRIPKELPIPGALLTRLMPQFLPTKVENEGIFGIKTFTTLDYATFVDTKKKLKIYVMDGTYDSVKMLFRTTENIYKVNETDSFFGYTFFLNPSKKDNLVRFVITIDGKTIGIEAMKKTYDLVKKLLTK